MKAVEGLTTVCARKVSGIKLSDEVLLFVDGSKESEEAVKMLRSAGVKFREIDVRRNGVRGWLLVEFGSMDTPIMVTASEVVIGLERIKEFVSRKCC